MSEHWIGLELRHLTALQAIAEEGSFKGAAARLGYTPSAISQQISTLERIVGTRVIARELGRATIGLTDAGEVLLHHMTAIERRLSDARSDLEALTKGVAGTLRVGVWESVGARLLPEVLRRLGTKLPDVKVDLVDAAEDLLLLRALEKGLLDVCFGVLPIPPGPFEMRTVLADPWMLVMQAGSKEEARSRVSSLRTGTLPLLCYRSARALEPALRHLHREGLELDVVLRSDYNAVLQELAAAGLGVALLPRLAVDLDDPRTTAIEVGSIVPPREIAVIWHRDRTASEAVRAFLALTGEMASKLQEAPEALAWGRSAAV
jgi:DNA-binding transcriptional LysR family regulator